MRGYWQEGDDWLIVQPLAEKVPREAWYDLHEMGRDLAMRAYVAGVADVFPCNVMWDGEDLIVGERLSAASLRRQLDFANRAS